MIGEIGLDGIDRDTSAGFVEAATADSVKEFYSTVTTPVCIVTAYDQQRGPFGTTVGSFCSVSLTPPLALISLLPGSELLSILDTGPSVRVHFPAATDVALAQRFAGKGGAGKFEGVEWVPEPVAPTFPDMGWVSARVSGIEPMGDHLVVRLHIDSVHRREDSAPLLYRARAFGTFWKEIA